MSSFSNWMTWECVGGVVSKFLDCSCYLDLSSPLSLLSGRFSSSAVFLKFLLHSCLFDPVII